MINRTERVAHLLKKEITLILQEEANDPLIGRVVITDVQVTRDLNSANVYYNIPDKDPKKKEETLKALNRAGRFVRGKLAKRVALKYVPTVSFREDINEEKLETLDDVFRKIEKEKERGES
ncbi:MAG: 30S ribosome-binding factor RbfA [Candidatus Omnitrophota bacterium]